MKLICELTEEVKFLTEEKDGKKNYFIEGVFMQSDIKNRNGRFYPSQILENEVRRYTKEYIKENRAFGELGHPQGPQINLERVSHMIKSLQCEGKNFVGKAKIMDTPYGNIVKNLMDEGAKLGVSSRGMGTLRPTRDGINEVQDDFHLSTAADIVADPSAPDAFVRGIMEDVEWIYENGILKAQKVDEWKHTIKRATKKELEEAKLSVFKDFIQSL